MKSIAEKVEKTVKHEISRLLDTPAFTDTLTKIKELEHIGIRDRQEYSYPLKDTIGKNYYTTCKQLK